MSSAIPLRGELDHVALGCVIPARDLAVWYRDILGFEPIDFENPNARFVSVRISNNTIIDFFDTARSSESKSLHNESNALSKNSHMCISISKEDFNELMERLRVNGVEFSFPPKKRSGARGIGFSIYLEDPDKNKLEFRYYD